MEDNLSSHSIIIDGRRIIDEYNKIYDGLGFISANNSSRLMMDYKDEHPQSYWEILKYVFGDDGLALNLFKLELGADIDSSSGTEPAVKRFEDEPADVRRGAGFRLAADALKINPKLKIDMLYWGLPHWVDNPPKDIDKYRMRYKWFKETLDAMYDEYGIKVSYITAGKNEREVEPEWIKYISRRLKEERTGRYDYGTIMIVAGEGVGDWKISRMMLEDKELMHAVDVVSSHYTSFIDDNTALLRDRYGKKVWLSEGSAPMKDAAVTRGKDVICGGIGGVTGTLDIASRITKAFTEGMTMYEFQPVISAYYDGVSYYPKQLITANKPWCGSYSIDSGYYMALHFARFIKPGWKFIDGACYGDGVMGGDGHAMVNSVYNYITCADDKTGDYSVIIVNNSEKKLTYELKISDMIKKPKPLNIWQTDDSKYFAYMGSICPDSGMSRITLEPFSMVTLSTLDISVKKYNDRTDCDEIMHLDYCDNFDYADIDKNYLPRYMSDRSGAFEVRNGVLKQCINYDNKGTEWGATPDPVTTFGDDRWQNYSVAVDVLLAQDRDIHDEDNYAGVCARYLRSTMDFSGYGLILRYTGDVFLQKTGRILASNHLNIDAGIWHRLEIEVNDNLICGYVDGEGVINYTDKEAVFNSGRVAILSAYRYNSFRNLRVSGRGNKYYVTRMDDMSPEIKYSYGDNEDDNNGWYFNVTSGFNNFNRTISKGGAGDSFEFEFTGNTFALIGTQENAVLEVGTDGAVMEYVCKGSEDRTAFYAEYGLENGTHSVKITVKDGKINLDAIEYR